MTCPLYKYEVGLHVTSLVQLPNKKTDKSVNFYTSSDINYMTDVMCFCRATVFK